MAKELKNRKGKPGHKSFVFDEKTSASIYWVVASRREIEPGYDLDFAQMFAHYWTSFGHQIVSDALDSIAAGSAEGLLSWVKAREASGEIDAKLPKSDGKRVKVSFPEDVFDEVATLAERIARVLGGSGGSSHEVKSVCTTIWKARMLCPTSFVCWKRRKL